MNRLAHNWQPPSFSHLQLARNMQYNWQFPSMVKMWSNRQFPKIQSGLSSRAKHGGTVFSAVSGSIKDLTTVPGFCNHLGPPNLINFAPALVFLSVLNVYSFAIEFGGCICYFWSKWISRAKYLTFPGDGRRRWGWIACNMQWLFMLFWRQICTKTTLGGQPGQCGQRGGGGHYRN